LGAIDPLCFRGAIALTASGIAAFREAQRLARNV
jgi:hypothetical protein